MDSKYKPQWIKKWQVVAGLCGFGWAFGLIYITDGGVYILGLFDQFFGILSFFLVGLGQVVALSWFYGASFY